MFLIACRKLEVSHINKITTDNINITNTTVKVTGKVIDISAKGIYQYGHCWSINPFPTINDPKTEFEGASPGKSFTSMLSDLTLNQTYYVRSYAMGPNEIIYGEEKTTSISAFGNVILFSDSMQIISESEISVNGSIANLGSLKVLSYGHCLANHPAATILDTKKIEGTNAHDLRFKSQIAGLNMQTNYYLRAFAILSNTKIIYGNEIPIQIPDLVVTTDNYSLSSSTATLQGAIVSLGFLPVVDYGHCWSYTSSNPNINDNVISKGATGAALIYYTNLLSLIPGTTYYFRAYARKGNTFKYGTVKSFKYL